jgi:hypothetical protein
MTTTSKKKPTRIKHPMHIEIMNTSNIIFSTEYKKLLDDMVQGVVESGDAEEYVRLVGSVERHIRKEKKDLSIVSLSFVLSRLLTTETNRKAMADFKDIADISIQ